MVHEITHQHVDMPGNRSHSAAVLALSASGFQGAAIVQEYKYAFYFRFSVTFRLLIHVIRVFYIMCLEA